MTDPQPFTPGTLWQRITRTTGHALSTGALVPISTSERFIEESGIRFAVRVLDVLRRKSAAREKQESGAAGNPFLPPERELTVADISDTHLAVLNKFNVVERHLLIVTREFEDQDTLLTLRDFEALWTCMREYDGLGFYNGGRDAGASQRHKHLQLVPLPLASKGPRVPLEPLFAGTQRPGITTVPSLPFLHTFVRLEPGRGETPAGAARTTHRLYGDLLRAVGLQAPSGGGLTFQSSPYCLLATREWMLLVPRSREHFEDISLNSLAFAGSFFVQSEEQLGRLKSAGPMNALRHVAVTDGPDS